MIQPSTIYNEKINQQIIEVPYLKRDVEMLLEMNKENILKQLTPENVF
jgi:serine protease inhibitor